MNEQGTASEAATRADSDFALHAWIGRPAESYGAWMERLGKSVGRTPRMIDWEVRWDLYDEAQEEKRDAENRVIQSAKPRRPREVGRERVFLAYLCGSMEREEEAAFSALITSPDQPLLYLAIVPVVRRLNQQLRNVGLREADMSKLVGSLETDIANLRVRVGALESLGEGAEP